MKAPFGGYLNCRKASILANYYIILGLFVLYVNSTISPIIKWIRGDDMRLRIRDLREDSDLKQQQIADYLHCDQSLYSKYERGEREIPLSAIIMLAQYYGTSIDYLAGLTDNKKPYPRALNK